MMMTPTCAVFAILLCAAGLPDDKPLTTDAELFGGPAIAESVERTLVRFDAKGRFAVLRDARPEEAALDVATIDPERRELARDLVAERSAALGALLMDEIDLMRASSDAIRTDDKAAAEAIYHTLHTMFDEDDALTPLLTDFADVLSEQELADVTGLVDDYWLAWVDWTVRKRRNKDKPGVRESARDQLAFSLFQRELTEAYNWSLRPFQKKLEAIYATVDPDDEQRAALRTAVIEYVRATRTKPDVNHRPALTRTIYDILNEQQRLVLFETLLDRL